MYRNQLGEIRTVCIGTILIVDTIRKRRVINDNFFGVARLHPDNKEREYSALVGIRKSFAKAMRQLGDWYAVVFSREFRKMIWLTFEGYLRYNLTTLSSGDSYYKAFSRDGDLCTIRTFRRDILGIEKRQEHDVERDKE